MLDHTTYAPTRRTADLVVRVQGDETLVLDTRNDRVHGLPTEVTHVWDACSGARTVADIAEATGLAESVVASSIEQLSAQDLLAAADGLGRRNFLRRSVLIGGAAISVPLIQTVLAPSAFAAGCSTNNVTFAQGDQDTQCTGNAAHAKYSLSVQGCSANTTFYSTITYVDDQGHTITETGKTLRTDASGNDTTNGVTTTQQTLKKGTSDVTLRLYTDQKLSPSSLVITVTVPFTITCPDPAGLSCNAGSAAGCILKVDRQWPHQRLAQHDGLTATRRLLQMQHDRGRASPPHRHLHDEHGVAALGAVDRGERLDADRGRGQRRP